MRNSITESGLGQIRITRGNLGYPLEAMKCPACQSSDVRASRYRPEDGLWRSIFYSAYRCRDCGRRFEQLTRAPLFGTVVVLSLTLTFSLGFLVGGALNGAPPRNEVAAPASLPPREILERHPDDSPVPSSPDLTLVASAEQGDPRAQLRLGMAYLKGDGVERNPATAIKWIERAAAQGYAEAQYALGAMHHSGRGALQSFPVAFRWFELAAQQNHADAQFSLGLMYRSGQGVPVDKAKAYTWFNLAAAQGHERAREARDSLLPALTPEQVLAAQRAAQDWRPAAAKK